MLDYLQLLTLYQAVRTLHPQYTGTHPPEHVIEKAQQINGENVLEFPLKSALEKGLGGEMYVQSKAYTKLGHFIGKITTLMYSLLGLQPYQLNKNHDSSNLCLHCHNLYS